MDLNRSPDLDSIDHWNRAVDAEDAEEYQTALEEYDACLCSSPAAETALARGFLPSRYGYPERVRSR
jgi:hypothetical protein